MRTDTLLAVLAVLFLLAGIAHPGWMMDLFRGNHPQAPARVTTNSPR